MSVQIEQLRAGCLKSFSLFCLTMQEDGWFDPVHEKICDEIQQELESKGVLGFLREKGSVPSNKLFEVKLAVVMPRGSLKSTIITKLLSIWMSLQDSNLRILIASNSFANGSKKIEDIKGLIDSNSLFRSMFPELLPDKRCTWTSESACLKRGKEFPESTFECAGVKTRIIGRHYDVIVEDDTVAPDESDLKKEVSMPSIEDIEKGIAWHRMAVGLFNPKGARVRIVVTTRWSDFDLIDYIEKNESYHIVNVPAMDENGTCIFTNFYSKEVLDNIAADLGPYMFSALYLNKPISEGNRLFNKEWIKYIDLVGSDGTSIIPKEAKYYVTLDPAISEKDSACETAIVGCYQMRDLIYVTDCFHAKYLPAEAISIALDLMARNEQSVALIVESNAYQKALTYFIQDEMKRRSLYKPVIPHQSRTPKNERIQGLQPLFANGQVLLKRGIDKIIETQLLQFPHGRLVDVIDCLAMQLKVYLGASSKSVSKPVEEDKSNLCWTALEELQKKIKGNPFDQFTSANANRIPLGIECFG